jgi:hypothetical protein
MAVIELFSSNTHDKSLEAAMTAAFSDCSQDEVPSVSIPGIGMCGRGSCKPFHPAPIERSRSLRTVHNDHKSLAGDHQYLCW